MDNELETITPDIDSDLITAYVENIRNGKWLLDE